MTVFSGPAREGGILSGHGEASRGEGPLSRFLKDEDSLIWRHEVRHA